MIEKVIALKTSLGKHNETLAEHYGQGMLDGFSTEFLGSKASILGSMQPQQLNCRTPVLSQGPQLETRLRDKMNEEIRHTRREFRPETCQYNTEHVSSYEKSPRLPS